MNLNTEHKDNRKLNPKRARNNTSAPPRTRPGQSYPGGKALRRAFAKLEARRKYRESTMNVNSRNMMRHKNVPGSMKP